MRTHIHTQTQQIDRNITYKVNAPTEALDGHVHLVEAVEAAEAAELLLLLVVVGAGGGGGGGNGGHELSSGFEGLYVGMDVSQCVCNIYKQRREHEKLNRIHTHPHASTRMYINVCMNRVGDGTCKLSRMTRPVS